MKNLFSSPSSLPDLQNFSKDIKLIQQQCIDLRLDLNRISRDLKSCVKGIALLVSTPEPDLESEQDSIIEDNSGSE